MPLELRNSRQTQLPNALDGRQRFALDCFSMAVQMREIGGPWQDIDPTVEQPDTGGFAVRFPQVPMRVRLGNDSRRRIYPDRSDPTYWIEFGKPFAQMGVPTRDGSWFVWDFPNAAIKVLVENTRIKFVAVLKNALAPTSLTFPFSSLGITRQGNLLYHNGAVVAELGRPVATGSNPGMPVSRECAIAFSPGAVTISLDPTGLQYPIVIDPTLDYQVGAGADDGHIWSTASYNNTNNYTIQGYSGSEYRSWYRFTAVTIPVGATIDVAYLTYWGYANGADANPLTKIWFDDQANPAAPTTYSDYTGRTQTTAGVDWDGNLTLSAWNNSPSIVSIIQELVNSYSYAAGAAMQALHRNDGGTGDRWTAAGSYNGAASSAAKLHIEYTVGAGLTWAMLI